jgi:hypothetical protein
MSLYCLARRQGAPSRVAPRMLHLSTRFVSKQNDSVILRRAVRDEGPQPLWLAARRTPEDIL